MLTNTEAYRSLEENLHKLGFKRAKNRSGQKVSWRWRTRTGTNAVLILELLADMPDARRVNTLPTDGNISALHIPHASIVFDMYETRQITADLLGENGIASVEVRHANLISFTCLKAFAFEDRNERKDAHDLIYCLEHCPQGIEHAAANFLRELNGKHADVVGRALGILTSASRTSRQSMATARTVPLLSPDSNMERSPDSASYESSANAKQATSSTASSLPWK